MTVRSRFKSLGFAALVLSAVAACGNDDPTAPVIAAGAADITQDITASRTLYAETTYTLKGFIHVKGAGTTLTINPGTTIKGDFNTLGASLFILQGAKIMAVGTAAKPIVFTSSQPVGSRLPGDWGGLIIVGKAINNRTAGSASGVEVEGTNTCGAGCTTSGQNYQVIYTGGTDNTDNSGELKYVRVEFGGFAPSNGNELNSFTFAAVGSGTKCSYLQAMSGLDDSYEWFGGNLDCDHLVSYEAGDDHFDMSESFSGRLQYLIAFQSTVLTPRSGAGNVASDPEGIENDGCNGSGCTNGFNTQPYTIPLVANFTLVGTGSKASSGSSTTDGGIGMMLRRGTGGYYVNGVVARYPLAGVSVRSNESYALAGSTATPNLATASLALRNILFAENGSPQVVFQAPTGAAGAEAQTQNSFDLTGNSLTNSTATTASLFTKFPTTVSATTTAADFDWTPAAGSAAASGGLATFTGLVATKAGSATSTGNTVAGTSFVGAASSTTGKWWDGWTVYFKN